MADRAPQRRIRRLLLLVILLAAVCVAVVFLRHPFPLHKDPLIAAATLAALAGFSSFLALRRTTEGTTTALDFIPQIGALLLIEPSAVVAITAVVEVSSQTIQRRGWIRASFNIAQLILSIALAGLVYTALGGTASLNSLPGWNSLVPYIGAVATYFTVNTVLVSYVVALSEGVDIRSVLQRLSGGPTFLAVDSAMSLLGYLIAYLYVNWGALALVLAAVPILGLRYSYGVNIELRQLNRDLLEVLIKALEARDPYTSGHSVRVAQRARDIAEELNLSRRHIRDIETAALLHDIGKIDQAYHDILRQEGTLSAEQRELIQQHPDRGVEILESIRTLDKRILDCIRHHHERYDGTGYPVGLGGEDIPLGARIIMVADTIDAMLTVRPYRDALPLSVVRSELKKNSGSQFDPKIVDAAIRAGILTSEHVDALHRADWTSLSIPH